MFYEQILTVLIESHSNHSVVTNLKLFTVFSITVNAQPLESTVDDKSDSKLPPLIFPKENVTIGTGLPPIIFPTENVTIGELSPIPVEKMTDIPPLIFPKTKGAIPLIELPPIVFPKDDETSINQTALDILNASSIPEGMHILKSLDEDYYKDDSSEGSDQSDEVENVQPIDKSPQTDNLEENYK